MRSSLGALFALLVLAAVGCSAPAATPKHSAQDAGPPVCCRTNPDAGPEGCLCEPAATNIVMVTGDTCSANTTVNGQAVDFTGFVVTTCP
jgi:hypothetical protein